MRLILIGCITIIYIYRDWLDQNLAYIDWLDQYSL